MWFFNSLYNRLQIYPAREIKKKWDLLFAPVCVQVIKPLAKWFNLGPNDQEMFWRHFT